MGEPAPIYDDEQSPDPYTPKPRFGVVDGEGQSTPRSKGHLKSVSSNDLNAAEQAGATPELDLPSTAEKNLTGDSDQIGGGFKKEGDRRKGRFSRKQKIAGGGIIGLLLGGGVGIITLISGPLQLLHLSKTLLPNFANQDHASNVRIRGLYRWAKTGNPGETRIGALSSKFVYPEIQKSLAKNGIAIGTDRFTGQITTLTIEPAKNPQYQGLSPDEARARIAADNGIDPAKVSQTSGLNGGKFSFNLRDSNIAAKRAAIRTHVESQNLGKIKTALQIRTLGKVHNAPSWLHPLKRAGASIDLKISTRIQRSNLFKEYEARRTAKAAARTAAAEARVAAVKSKLRIGAGAAGAVLLGSTAVCVAKDVASEVPALNRENIVIPAMKSSVDAMALGAQIQSGHVPSDGFEQMGTIVQNLKDEEGRSIWEGRALQSELGHETGEDIDPDLKQAFSPESSASNIEQALDSLGADALCSKAGQLFSTVAGTALLFVPGVGVATKIVSTAAGAAVITAITTLLPRILDNDTAIGVLHQGPNGGNVDAYGAREAANSSFRSTGGSELSSAQSAALKKQHDQLDKEEFQAKSFASRIFDVYDHRSIAGKLIDKTSSSPVQNVASAARGLTSGAWLTGLSSLFTPKTYAATEVPYDYGFPEYGFSLSDLEDPLVEDPYANADEVAKILNGLEGQKYIDKAKVCFGVDIVKGADGWDAITSTDVNPSTADYAEANCLEAGNNDWLRVRFFVFDSQAMNSYACYEGDESSCTQLGFGANTSSSTGAATGSGVDTSAMACPSDPDITDGGVVEKYGPGKILQYRIRLCLVFGIDVNVSIAQNTANMIRAAAAQGVTLQGGGYRTYEEQVALRVDHGCASDSLPASACSPPTASPGTSNHEDGEAIDFTNCGSRGTACYQWLATNAATYGLINLPSEPWHWSRTGN